MRLSIALLSFILPAIAVAEAPEDILFRAAIDPIFVARHINWKRCVAAHYFDQLANTKGYRGDPQEAMEICDAEWTNMFDRIRELNVETRISKALGVRIRRDAERSFPPIHHPSHLVDRNDR